MSDIDLIKHELGHWLLAKEYGFNPGYIVIGREGGFAHSFPKPTINELQDLENYLFQRISCLQAGLISELMKEVERGVFDIDIQVFEIKKGTTAKGDWDKIHELLLIYRGLIHNHTKTNQELDDDIQEFYNKCYKNSFDIIKEHFKIIVQWTQKIRNIYKDHKKLSSDDLCFEFIDEKGTFETNGNFNLTI